MPCQTTIGLDFMDAVNGVRRELQVQSQGTCGTCSGSGDQPGTQSKTCSKCAGRGMVRTLRWVVVLRCTAKCDVM